MEGASGRGDRHQQGRGLSPRSKRSEEVVETGAAKLLALADFSTIVIYLWFQIIQHLCPFSLQPEEEARRTNGERRWERRDKKR